MKKRVLLLATLPLLFSSLSGCTSSESNRVTYGTLISQDINSLVTLSTADLYNKAMNEEETFLLAVYQGLYSDDCLCWNTFQSTIASYMNKYQNYVYLYDAQSQNNSISDLEIDKYDSSEPCLYVFKGKKQLARYSYLSSVDMELFENSEIMNQKISKVVEPAKLLYVDDEYLAKSIKEKNESVVLFARSGCSDCNYVLPYVIIPYMNSHNTSKNICIFDMQKLYELSKDEDATEQEKALYQATKDKYGLSASANSDFGYQQGVVPTIQYYKDGELKDVSVFFNDKVDQKEDGSFYVSDSYYTSERVSKLSYLKDVNFTTILKGIYLEENMVAQTKSGTYYWLQDHAANYHIPIFKAFLDEYVH